MTLEAQIAALLAEAEPLRCLPDEEAEAQGLPALVDRINALRAKQSAQALKEEVYALVENQQFVDSLAQKLPKRGRPPKARQEGAEA